MGPLLQESLMYVTAIVAIATFYNFVLDKKSKHRIANIVRYASKHTKNLSYRRSARQIALIYEHILQKYFGSPGNIWKLLKTVIIINTVIMGFVLSFYTVFFFLLTERISPSAWASAPARACDFLSRTSSDPSPSVTELFPECSTKFTKYHIFPMKQIVTREIMYFNVLVAILFWLFGIASTSMSLPITRAFIRT